MEDSFLRVAAQQEQVLGDTLHQPNILDLVTSSGPVVQGVLYLLIFFSIISWAIVFYKFRQLRRVRRESERFTVIFWETKNLSSIHTASLEMQDSSTAQIFRAGYQELMRISRGRKQPQVEEKDTAQDSFNEVEEGGVGNVERAMRRAGREQMTRLERGLTFLATTASTAPFVGLFGTVWGIMNAFLGLSSTTTTTIQAVAPGIAEALIATAIGLAAAIPSVMAYNHFSRQVKVVSSEMENFLSEFLNIAERHFL
jgi:biopolymer transport protein TolQ